MPTTVPFLPVTPYVVVGDIFGLFDGIITSCVAVPTYTVECMSLFKSMIDNYVHDVFAYDIQVCADQVSFDFVSVNVVFSGLISFVKLVFCGLNNFAPFVFWCQQLWRIFNSFFVWVGTNQSLLILSRMSSFPTATACGWDFQNLDLFFWSWFTRRLIDVYGRLRRIYVYIDEVVLLKYTELSKDYVAFVLFFCCHTGAALGSWFWVVVKRCAARRSTAFLYFSPKVSLHSTIAVKVATFVNLCLARNGIDAYESTRVPKIERTWVEFVDA